MPVPRYVTEYTAQVFAPRTLVVGILIRFASQLRLGSVLPVDVKLNGGLVR